MHIIKYDNKAHRIDITLSGVISFEEAEEIKEKIIKDTEELTPGFDVVNNISKFIQGDEKAGAIIQEIINYFISKGVKRIVRVVGTSKTGLLQFAKFTQEHENVTFHYFPTLEVARDFLEKNS